MTEQGSAGLRIAAANNPAKALGIETGLRFADAKSRAPDIVAEPIDRQADMAALQALGLWATRWTPLSSLNGDDALQLDITGCARVFGGEGALLQDIAERMDAGGLTCRLGVASTPGAAWALSRYGQGRVAVCRDDQPIKQVLENLPVGGLRLTENAERLLRRFGLTRIGQLYDIDRSALARRFASKVAANAVRLRLDQALGLYQEPLTPLKPAPDYLARLSFVEPLTCGEAIAVALAGLARTLCNKLERDGCGARDFVLTAFRSDGETSTVSLSTARSVRDVAHIRRLFRDRLENINPGFGIDLMTLAAFRPDNLQAEERHLSADLAPDPVDRTALAALADRLTARLGEGAVRIPCPINSHDPARAETHISFEGETADWNEASLAPREDRPARMLNRPEAIDVLAEVPDGPPVRFAWRRVSRLVTRADGPERIAPEWWRTFKSDVRARDYYRIEDEDGRRYWLFRDGLYSDGRGGDPRWYIHALFS